MSGNNGFLGELDALCLKNRVWMASLASLRYAAASYGCDGQSRGLDPGCDFQELSEGQLTSRLMIGS